MSRGVVESWSGGYRYLSDAPGREGAERGREAFRIDRHEDGSRVVTAHSEIDDAPAVVRDISLRINPEGLPADCSVRIAVGGRFAGSGWFTFGAREASCETLSATEGRLSQRVSLTTPVRSFGSHAIVNDGLHLSLYDLSKGPGEQHFNGLYLSSPDHRGATGPLLFPIDLTIAYFGQETLTTAMGPMEAHHFAYTNVPGLLEEHPYYDLWCTTDGSYLLLLATVGGYMQTRYELVSLSHQRMGEAL